LRLLYRPRREIKRLERHGENPLERGGESPNGGEESRWVLKRAKKLF
jgi:hypothetical protein